MKSAKDVKWENQDLIEFYEKIPPEKLRSMAIEGGFENGCDIDLAYPYIKDMPSVMEIGAAYGRVIRNLIEKGYQGKIYAIERSKKLYNLLQQDYGGIADITNADIQSYHQAAKVNVILWMWSDICEFPQNKQLDILKHLTTWLTEDGFFVLETILHTLVPKNSTISEEQSYIYETEYGTAYGYIPSSQEIDHYAKKLGFTNVIHIPYLTSSNRQRILHIIKRN